MTQFLEPHPYDARPITMRPGPGRSVGVLPDRFYQYSFARDLIALLPLEMWVQARRAAGERETFEVMVWGPERRLSGWQEAAAAWGLRIDRWHSLSQSIDDCRVAMDWFETRGIGATLEDRAGHEYNLWTRTGPRPTLKFFVAMDFEVPTSVATDSDRLTRAAHFLGAQKPFRSVSFFRRPQYHFADHHGAHRWLAQREGLGARLVALRGLTDDDPFGRAYLDPHTFAGFDEWLRRLVRLNGRAIRSHAPAKRDAVVEIANTLRTGDALRQTRLWLNDAERRADSGLPVDFTLPRLLGLSETAQMRIIP